MNNERINNQPVVVYKDYSELPLTLSATDVSAVLGVSKTLAYELFRSKGFPVIVLGRRKLVARDKFLAWLDNAAN